MRQVDVSDSMGAVYQTENAQLSASLHDAFPWHTHPGNGDDGVEDGHPDSVAFIDELLRCCPEGLHQVVIFDRVDDLYHVPPHGSRLFQRLDSTSTRRVDGLGIEDNISP